MWAITGGKCALPGTQCCYAQLDCRSGLASLAPFWSEMRGKRSRSLVASSNFGHRFERIKFDLFHPALDRHRVELLAREVEPGRLCGAAREHQRAIIFLGQPFEPCRGIHGVADRGDDL